MDRHDLAQRIADAAVRYGTFTLRSGRTSHYYLDKYRFTTRPELLGEIGRLLAARISPNVTRLAGAELGGIPLVTAASLETGLPAVFIRNQKKDYGTAQQIEGAIESSDTVVVVEDIATTGGQVVEAAKAIAETGATIDRIIAVIDREEGARENIEAAGFVFESLFTKHDLGIEEREEHTARTTQE